MKIHEGLEPKSFEFGLHNGLSRWRVVLISHHYPNVCEAHMGGEAVKEEIADRRHEVKDEVSRFFAIRQVELLSADVLVARGVINWLSNYFFKVAIAKAVETRGWSFHWVCLFLRTEVAFQRWKICFFVAWDLSSRMCQILLECGQICTNGSSSWVIVDY